MKSRDGKELLCVSCSSNKPESQIQSVGTYREKQAEAIVRVDDSAHLLLLEEATISIFRRLDLFDTEVAYKMAVDLLKSLRTLSGGKVRVTLFNYTIFTFLAFR